MDIVILLLALSSAIETFYNFMIYKTNHKNAFCSFLSLATIKIIFLQTNYNNRNRY